MGIVECITACAKTLGAFIGFQSKKLDLKNSAPVQAAQAAQQETDAVDKTRSAIANHDTAEIRKEIAE